MSTVLEYEGYRQDQFDSAEFPLHAPGHGRGVAGLSPFDVPVSVKIEITPSGEAIFVYAYPDSEVAEKNALQWPGLTGVGAVLGVYSRRILRLQVSAADMLLNAGPLRLDPRSAWAWFAEESTEIQLAGSRNAEVISRIMSEMPDSVRQAVIDVARSNRSSANRTISRL